MTSAEGSAPSRFIAYADEAGSPVIGADARDFPIFVLVFLIVRKDAYVDRLVPAVQRLKFDFVGHDQIVLHEREIRRQANDFAFLQVSEELREAFFDRVDGIVGSPDVALACAVILKAELERRYHTPWDPYSLALTFCMERLARHLISTGERDTEVTVVFEARGTREDQQLEVEFRRIASGQGLLESKVPGMTRFAWRPIFAKKSTNSAGLQIADLAARPLGLSVLRPSQTNRAVEVMKPRLLFPHPKVFP